jgi:hypothetical protein
MKSDTQTYSARKPVLLGAIVFLAALWATGPDVVARGQGGNPEPGMRGVQKAKKAPVAYLNVKEFVAKGYSVVGPLLVSSFNRKAISLYTGQEDINIPLRGKRLILKPARGVSSVAIKKGTMVYVCRKDKEVRVYVLPAKEAKNDQ